MVDGRLPLRTHNPHISMMGVGKCVPSPPHVQTAMQTALNTTMIHGASDLHFQRNLRAGGRAAECCIRPCTQSRPNLPALEAGWREGR